jgi:hypothetical protein
MSAAIRRSYATAIPNISSTAHALAQSSMRTSGVGAVSRLATSIAMT